MVIYEAEYILLCQAALLKYIQKEVVPIYSAEVYGTSMFISQITYIL